jgi:hypothetical protein
MNEKEKKLEKQIKATIDKIWCDYYTEEGIDSGDIAPYEEMTYGTCIEHIANIIYKVGESNRVQKIKDLNAFEKAMQVKYPILFEIADENTVYDKKTLYTAWLKFPYYSTDSNGGFFSFYTEEEFEQYMTSSIRMFTEKEIKEQQFEIEQYSEFYNAEHKPVFDLDKALDLFHKAKFGDIEVVGYGINISNKNTLFERLATFNDENIAKAFYHLLLASEEIKLGSKIDLEKIYEGQDGYEYEIILSNYRI